MAVNSMAASLPQKQIDLGEFLALLPSYERTSSMETTRPLSSFSSLKKLLVCVLAAGILFAMQYFDKAKVQALVLALQQDPVGGLAMFLFLFIMGIVFLFPGMLLSVGAGVVYGFALGSLIAWASTVLGQCLAFLLGRYLLQEWVASQLTARLPNFRAIEMAIMKKGWRLVCLLRLSPLVPYNMLNYLLAITSISFRSFALPSAVCITPYTLMFVYMGSASKDLAKVLASPRPQEMTILWLVLSIIFFSVTLVYITMTSRAALQAVLSDVDPGYTESSVEIQLEGVDSGREGAGVGGPWS